MNDIPPKHTPDDVPPTGGNMVSFYQAASNANADSFPVLKAFQDYIEAEREQARKRVFTLSVFFAVIICAVVGGFLAAGIYLLRDMSVLQGKLVDAALAPRTVEAPAPVYITQPVPPAHAGEPQIDLVEKTVEEISKVTAALQSDIGKRIDGVTEISSQVHEKVSAQESELEKLRQELGQMKAQNEQLKGDFETMRTHVTRPPSPAAAIASVAPPPRPAAAVTDKPAVPEPPPVAATPDVPATKEPPVAPDGVKPPDAPKGMMATSIPLESKNTGTIPWRVIIPE